MDCLRLVYRQPDGKRIDRGKPFVSIKDRLNRRMHEEEKKDFMDSGTHHSGAYHREFEGYTEYRVPKKNGRGYRIQREYTGKTYCPDLTETQHLVRKILYTVSFLIAIGCFMLASTADIGSNYSKPVVFFEVCAIIFLFWDGISLFNYLTVKGAYKIPEYKRGCRNLKIALGGTGISLLCSGIASVLYGFIAGWYGSVWEIIGYFIGGALMLGAFILERQVVYHIQEGREPSTTQGIEIS